MSFWTALPGRRDSGPFTRWRLCTPLLLATPLLHPGPSRRSHGQLFFGLTQVHFAIQDPGPLNPCGQAGSEVEGAGLGCEGLHLTSLSSRDSSCLRELNLAPHLATPHHSPWLLGGGRPQCEPRSLWRKLGAASLWDILGHPCLPSEKSSGTSRS